MGEIIGQRFSTKTMSAKGKAPAEELNRDTIEEEELATHQEIIPIPFLCGTQMVAIRFISPALDRVAKQAPNERPGKK